MLKPLGDFNVYKEYGRIYVDLDGYDYEEIDLFCFRLWRSWTRLFALCPKTPRSNGSNRGNRT